MAEAAGLGSLLKYCAQDCLVTGELVPLLQSKLDEDSRRIATFEHACQGPALTLMLRGIRRDPGRALEALRQQARAARELQATLPPAGFTYGKDWCPSPLQLSKWLYGTLGLPGKRNKDGQLSTNEDCLYRLKQDPKVGEEAVGWIDTVLELRRLDKDRQVLEQRTDSDGRLRASWNVGATETGRWSCSGNPTGGGGNLQALRHEVRAAFVPDPGMVMVQADLRTAESHTVAALAGDPAYIRAHETGDTHLQVCNILWPEKAPWSDKDARLLRPEWRPDQPFRQMAKRVQHASNYGQTHFGMARTIRIPQAAAAALQRSYFRAFPGIQRWQGWTRDRVDTTGELTTPLGRRRQFLGRSKDKETHKEAIAHVPQSHVGDVLNLGLLRVWAALDPTPLQILAQGHDAILFQVPEQAAEQTLAGAQGLMEIPVQVLGIDGIRRRLALGVGSKVGGDWAEVS